MTAPVTVVAGYDSRPESADALALAGVLAGAWGTSVLASWVPEARGPYTSRERAWERLLREEILRLKDEAEQILAGGPEWELTAYPATAPARGLHDLAKEDSSRAIVVGSSHLGPLGRVIIGSTAARLLVDPPCPIAVAPRGWRKGNGTAPVTLGVGLDGCHDCDAALAEARVLAAGFGARLVALAVGPHAPPSRAGWRRARAHIAERVDVQLERGGGSSTERLVLDGHAAPALAAASSDLDLLVVGCRACAGVLGHPTVTSVSRRLMRTAECPVLVVPESLVPATTSTAG